MIDAIEVGLVDLADLPDDPLKPLRPVRAITVLAAVGVGDDADFHLESVQEPGETQRVVTVEIPFPAPASYGHCVGRYPAGG